MYHHHHSVAPLLLLLMVLLLGVITPMPATAFLHPSSASMRPLLAARSPSQTTTLAVASTPVPPTAEAGAAAGAAAARRPRREVNVLQVIESPGGYMAKVKVQNFNDKSSHTVTSSKELFEETCALAGRSDVTLEDYFKAVFKFAMAKGMPLQNTEGILLAELFPINYFSVSQLSIYLDGCTEGIAEILKDM